MLTVFNREWDVPSEQQLALQQKLRLITSNDCQVKAGQEQQLKNLSKEEAQNFQYRVK